MTRRGSSRLAGLAFLLYFAFGIPTMVLFKRATAGEGVAAKLASIAQHTSDMKTAVLFVLFTSFCALVLGVTLWAITREQDADLAMLAMICRVCEGLAGALSVQRSMGLLWLASPAGPNSPDAATTHALGAWLLLRGRMIPAPLAWLGVVASAGAVVALPLEFVGLFPSRWIWFIWLPLAAYEIPLALWLLFKGATAPSRSAVRA